MSPHLNGVDPQTELDYAMTLSGPPAKVNDTVRVLVVSAGNTKGDARVSDRTGPVEVPGGLPCNPVILYFLEHDIVGDGAADGRTAPLFPAARASRARGGAADHAGR